jgi:hypothetical protein
MFHRQQQGARALILAAAAVVPTALAGDEGPATLKEERAEAILAREEGRGRPFDPAFRAAMKARLAAAAEAQLEAVERRGEGLLPPAVPLGEPPPETIYTPVVPCRIIDTRLAGGALAAGAQRNFYVAGTSGFAAQGGNPAGCEVPLGPAKAAVINFVAVNPGGAGNLRAWAYGGATPTASILNYSSGLNLANGLVIPLCNTLVTNCAPSDITVQADVSGTHLVADVVGFFHPEYRSYTVLDSATSGGSPVPATCANTGGVQVSVVAARSGTIVLRGLANMEFLHINGLDDELRAFIGTTATDCPAASAVVSRVPGVLPSFSAAPGLWVEMSPVRTINVAAGTYTFFLNFQNTGGAGAGNDRFRYGALTATFEPF